jgi:predicted phosphodiesterase
MKIRYISDLHLEQFYGRDPAALVLDFIPECDLDKESVLVLAGDISASFEILRGFLHTVSTRFLHTIYVPGNHEYYHYDYDDWNRAANELQTELGDRVTIAAGEVRVPCINNVRFIACTLWADGGKNPLEQIMVQNGLYDFRVIQKVKHGKQRTFTVSDMIELHLEQKSTLEQALFTEFNGPTVVVTHHVPSYSLCHPRFGTSINGGFASECSDLMLDADAPKFWIFGHTHDTVHRKIGETVLVCNPKGYKNEHRTSEFNQFSIKYIEV